MISSKHLLSIIIPAHNEEAGIQHAIKEISSVVSQCDIKYEVIVVDDGSQDNTYNLVCEMAGQIDNSIKAIKFSRNFGKESAILAGLRAAKGDAVITIDADLQHPPEIIPLMLKEWQSGTQVVSAVKENRASDSLAARVRASVFNGLLSRLGGIDVRNSSDFKLLDRVVVDIIINQFPERIRFYRGLADWVGYKQKALPFTVADRNAGEGKWSLFGLIDLATTALVSFTSAPLRIVTILGSITLIFGFFVAGEALWSWLQGEAVSGFATLIITQLIIGSFIMISMGIIGEYIAKIYDEIKARPAYLVDSRNGFDAIKEDKEK